MSCRHCQLTCKSQSCFDHHKTENDKKLSPCDRWWKCTICKKIVDKKQQKVDEHVCDTYFCKSCEKIVETQSHNCYIRCCKPKEKFSRFIFFDFECTQESDPIQCEEGYLPSKSENCSLCKELKTICTKCMIYTHCLKKNCGNKTHNPNLVVATTVCEMCINDSDCSPESKCEYCGTRCTKCKAFDKKRKMLRKSCLSWHMWLSWNRI